MKITIVENEIYLAQSIQNNLSEKLNAKSEIFASYNEAMDSQADIFLINTNLKGNIKHLITAKKDKIIILLAPYVTYSTVMQPIEMGADDYLQKPFSIEELIRKINHLTQFYDMKEKIESFKNFINFIFKDVEMEIPKYSFPVFLKSSINKAIEKFIFEIAKKENATIKLIDLKKFKKEDFKNRKYLYVCLNYEKIKDEKILNFISKFKTILILPKDYEKEFNYTELNASTPNLLEDDIFSIEEYIKFIINNYQYKFPDTELSKRLGISRKSLWEKRKKYEIFKQK